MVVEGELDKLRKKECIFDVRVRGAVGWDPSLSVIMKSVHRPHFLVSDDPPPDFYSCIDAAELHKVERLHPQARDALEIRDLRHRGGSW